MDGQRLGVVSHSAYGTPSYRYLSVLLKNKQGIEKFHLVDMNDIGMNMRKIHLLDHPIGQFHDKNWAVST